MNTQAAMLAAISIIWGGTAFAGPPDFSICDGQAGVALGLCHGGVAAGCADSGAGTAACLAIEQRYRAVSEGSAPPWISARYPVHTVSLEWWVGLDLETGTIGYGEGVKAVEETPFPYCQEIGLCDAIDVIPDVWEETAGDSGNPFMFWQRTCRVATEPGFGGVPEFVVLRDRNFDTVTDADIAKSTFLQAQYDGVHVWGALPHMDGNDTLIVRTCAGNYLKLGNQTCNYPGSEWPQCKDPNLPENWMKIDYQMIRPTQ